MLRGQDLCVLKIISLNLSEADPAPSCLLLYDSYYHHQDLPGLVLLIFTGVLSHPDFALLHRTARPGLFSNHIMPAR